jgi:Transposase DDE domain group 1
MKISHEQSRRNAARRRRRVAARHALAGHWGRRPVPVFGAGPVAYEIGTNIDATCFGGIAAVHRLVTKLGLVEQINDRLRLLKVHLPYHESDHVLNLAYNVVCGGTRLEGIERLRHDSAYMTAVGADLIPDPTTAGDFCRRFTQADVTALMEAINAVRPKLWTGRGRELLGPIAYIDADGTIAATDGRCKQGMDMSFKGIWGYAPLIVSLANTREVLYLVNRPGNAPSHQGAAGWIDKAIDLVAPHAPRVCLRRDTDFSLTAHFDRWAKRVDLIFGMDASPALRQRAEALDDKRWRRLHATGTTRARRPNHKQRIVRERGYLNLQLHQRTPPSSTTSPANAPAPTASSCYARTSAAAVARTCSSTRSATSSTSPPAPT